MSPLSRRAFASGLPLGLLGGGALGGGFIGSGLAPILGATPGLAATPAAPASVTPLAQIRIGRFTVTALTDGFADMPYTFFPGRTPAEVEQAAVVQHTARPSGVRFLFNQYLVEDGARRILIDAGPAGSIGQTGALPQALGALGLQRDQIDAVIVTHMHQDHMGGLIVGGQKTFPKAELYVDRRDVKHWTDPAKANGAPDYLQTSFRMADQLVRLYPKLQAIDGEREIARGVSIVDLTGHTPGHIGVRIEDGGQSLIMVSDMLFPVVHPAATDVVFLFEQDRPAAQAMRDRFFPLAASEGALIAATHMPFPGLGRIVSDRGQLRWQVADWALQD
ncbi:MBL fold metallo-hydrolase [Chelatococcus asaccharovorans]|uniref:Glyoxylase-like metal-dependent hydrolase (Beta-lactamase superfamily II) n=1 Tax=Chelatococcus asaccharovorans TaxID=28210 RepID=A0A2V3TZI5_9HYPH|nr:MBL fold metallo-hydrolase [Chelatococcus asaccharovorans]MBS7704743.1 MBL fold metallo-hydrolase [Chelatococcus asaccharovorans]PXW54643.1 glyoxylase-like metal-dependent hydrolase (beta-lactamase superfamily II) [Chelatococcus asaccharovorans]